MINSVSAVSRNNSNESGILIYNKVAKASSTTVASYMFKFAAQNNFTHKHNPFGTFCTGKKNYQLFIRLH